MVAPTEDAFSKCYPNSPHLRYVALFDLDWKNRYYRSHIGCARVRQQNLEQKFCESVDEILHLRFVEGNVRLHLARPRGALAPRKTKMNDCVALSLCVCVCFVQKEI